MLDIDSETHVVKNEVFIDSDTNLINGSNSVRHSNSNRNNNRTVIVVDDQLINREVNNKNSDKDSTHYEPLKILIKNSSNSKYSVSIYHIKNMIIYFGMVVTKILFRVFCFFKFYTFV